MNRRAPNAGARRARPAGLYSGFVRFMRIMLPVAALGILAVIVLWPRLQGLDTGLIVPQVGDLDLEADGRVRLDQPRYVGRGDDGDAFSVEAEAGRVDPRAPNRIELERMRADLPGSDERQVELRAAEALYDRDQDTLDLGGEVRLVTSDGYELRTTSAHVDVANGTVATTAPVDGDGPTGTIVADRMDAADGGAVITFRGNVHVVIHAEETGS
ncbi:MAG: LPS export ABC transporter periplasmic protein LptC [Pseudomonadota bacterium]